MTNEIPWLASIYLSFVQFVNKEKMSFVLSCCDMTLCVCHSIYVHVIVSIVGSLIYTLFTLHDRVFDTTLKKLNVEHVCQWLHNIRFFGRQTVASANTWIKQPNCNLSLYQLCLPHIQLNSCENKCNVYCSKHKWTKI